MTLVLSIDDLPDQPEFDRLRAAVCQHQYTYIYQVMTPIHETEASAYNSYFADGA